MSNVRRAINKSNIIKCTYYIAWNQSKNYNSFEQETNTNNKIKDI